MARRWDYDLYVIGGGSAGVRLARTSGALGAKVALAEEARLGGTCVNVGCVPKKLFVYSSRVAHELADAANYGWTIPTPSFDWRVLRANEEKEVARLNGIYRRLLVESHVDVHDARAVIEGPNTLRVDGRVVTAERIAICTGSTPRRPDIPGAELGMISDDVFVLEQLPRSIIIVGAGYIACEFASIFASLGVETRLVARGERLLPHFDREVGLTLQRELAKQDIHVTCERHVMALEKRGDRIAVRFDRGDEKCPEELLADRVLFAIGRHPNCAGLGIEALSIKYKPDGAITVDDEFRTNVPSIHALGDVIGRVQLTPVALAEGTALAHTLFGSRGKIVVDYEAIPTAVFTTPEIATVGLTEAQARRHHEILVFRTDFRPLKHTVSGRDERTLMKMIVDRQTDRVLGVHVVGESAAEMVQSVAVAMKAGATKAHFDATIGIHPTAAEELVTLRTPVKEP
ncbi:glutathione-disulfide reductase [Sandaracinus amylolyticus]|uniref:glutathione-disulfide reductase n=1 Tax=Sandaracinus amylolyticus TaxID=927083 RepID=UPI001EFFD4A2|nr:glutathione-disulfide reductase [Sandaracinus amylolyticus]UJR81545.1 Glutathione-disulfide reductase [Sandaracinus amylolyticus]